MNSSSPLITAIVIAIAALSAWETQSAPVESCPVCDPKELENEPVVCAEEVSGFQGTFENFCEVRRFNCINERAYYVVRVGSRCDPSNDPEHVFRHMNTTKAPVHKSAFSSKS